MARSSLVPSVAGSGLAESLQRFTPRAREDRRLELAGLEQQSDIRESTLALNQARLVEQQAENRRSQILDVANQNRTILIKDKNNLTFALKDGPEGIRNNLAILTANNKDDPDFDLDEVVQFANMATKDPDEAFRNLTNNQLAVNNQLKSVDQILNRGKKGKFIGTPVRVVRDGKTFLTGIVQDPDGSFSRRDVPIEGELVSTIGETPEQKKQRTIAEAGGKAAATAEVKLKTEPTIEASKAAAKAAIKRSENAFDKIGQIRKGIANIDEAIRLIDEGAATGVVAARLPSVRASSIELDNLQGRLGLDVIGNTTFGALSESELKFALATALPKTLKGPDLKRWLQRKKESQQKLSAYLERVATFLGTPGNTTKDFIELEKLNQLDRESQADLQSLSNEQLLQLRQQQAP